MRKFIPLLTCLIAFVLTGPARAERGRDIVKGSTDQTTYIRIIDSIDGTPETGVVAATAGLDLEYLRVGAAPADLTENDLAATDSAHSDGGIKHVGGGEYRVDLPDAAVATGVNGVLVQGTVTGMIVLPTNHQLVDFTPYDATPTVDVTNVDGAALDTHDAGSFPADVRLYGGSAGTFASGRPEVNVSHWLGTAAATPTTAGVPEVDLTHWLGTAAATPTVAGVPEVDVTHFGGTAGTFASGLPDVGIATADQWEIAVKALAAERGYKNIYYLASTGNDANNGTTPALAELTPTAARGDASAGDLIVVLPGIYTTATQIGKQGVDWYLCAGAELQGTGDQNGLFNIDETFGDPTALDYNVWGYGTLAMNSANPDVFLAVAGRVSIEAAEIDCDGIDVETYTGGELRIKCPRFVNMSGNGNFRIHAGSMVVETDTKSGTGSIVAFDGAGLFHLRASRATTTAADIINSASAAGTFIFEGGILESTHASANGVNVPTGVEFIGLNCAIKMPAGRPSLSGAGNIYLANCAYDTATSTATNILSTDPLRSTLQSTTIASLSSQTNFTLTAGSSDNDAYNGAIAVITDATTAQQKSFCVIDDYVGLTKTVILVTAPKFTIAFGDKIDIISGTALAPDALGNQQLATTAVDEIQANLATNGVGLTAAALANVNTQADTALTDYGALKPTTLGRTLDVGTSGTAEANLGEILGSALTETSAGRIVGNFKVFYDNDDALTASTLDDINSGVGGNDWTATERNYWRWIWGIPGTQTEIPNWSPNGLSKPYFDSVINSQPAFDTLVDNNADLQAILVDTNELQGLWTTGGARTLALDDVPNTAEFNARTLLEGSYFDPAADNVTVGGFNAAGTAAVTAASPQVQNDGTVTVTSQTQLVLSDGPATNDWGVGYTLVIDDASVPGMSDSAEITAYAGSTKTATIAAPLLFTVANSDPYRVMLPTGGSALNVADIFNEPAAGYTTTGTWGKQWNDLVTRGLLALPAVAPGSGSGLATSANVNAAGGPPKNVSLRKIPGSRTIQVGTRRDSNEATITPSKIRMKAGEKYPWKLNFARTQLTLGQLMEGLSQPTVTGANAANCTIGTTEGLDWGVHAIDGEGVAIVPSINANALTTDVITINVEVEPDEGDTFKVSIPVEVFQ